MKIFILFSFLLCTFPLIGQNQFNQFIPVYPIGDDPNLRFLSSYRPEETILMEANPTVRYSVYNNFLKGMMKNYFHTQAWYISARPQLRMYSEASFPIKTPSYRLLLGTQHLFKLPDKFLGKEKLNFIGFSLESGHYSNGQINSAFSEKYKDESPESDSIYNSLNSDSDLSNMLNRNSGNFSTNLTELIFNYRVYKICKDNSPLRSHSFTIGAVLYHDKFIGILPYGGHSQGDIKIYGRWMILSSYEYVYVFNDGAGSRISFKESIEVTHKAHAKVNPLRSETLVTYYPFAKSKALGLFVSYIYGHDNYNYRLVDSGHQISIGFSWCQFTPFIMTNK